MQIDQLHHYLDQPSEAEAWLESWGLEDARRGHANLVRLAGFVTLDLLANLSDQLSRHLPQVSDPDMALNNLERFVGAVRSPLSLVSLFERDPEALPILLQILSTSQHLSDLLVTDSESYELLRLTGGQPVSRQTLIDELTSEIDCLNDERSVMAALRRFKRRETLRISYGDIIRGQSLETVVAQISYLAEAIVDSAVRFARRRLEGARGLPKRNDGQNARFVVLGLGKLGGTELNYSSDIDLIFLHDAEGHVEGRKPNSNAEFFDRLAREAVKLLSEQTELGHCYRVDLRLRPEGSRGSAVHSLESALQYYDVVGRTWERQAYVKARSVAGDMDLGSEFLAQLEPWIYRRYLSRADISGIKALKRRIEHRTLHGGADQSDVKTGRGGIRDIEFVIQFLQLLNGGDLPGLRTGNTLTALAALESAGCLTHQERSLLEDNYRFLRKIEHRLQIMFDLQTHLLPGQTGELRKLALRMGYIDRPTGNALTAFESDYRSRTELNRKILDHLLHDAFGDDAQAEPEVDLVLDPDPPPERVAEVLSRHRFRDVRQAYANLTALGNEKIRFLSTRRCRHFLASIAPRLLAAIGATTDPDSTLVNLEKVSDSLGGKGVLWELFSFSPPTLHLYVELCANSPFLSDLLISNPGMLDELMDSLVLNKLPTLDWLQSTLGELCRAAEDLDPILHSFKNTQTLRVGVRSILGKEDVATASGTLSDIAQACIAQVAVTEHRRLVDKLGQPVIGEGDRAGQPCELVILALGKFGGRELSYHGDLDLIFVFEADGQTVPSRRAKRPESTTNQHFFSELAARIVKAAGQLGPNGRLYEIDPRLRPTGKSGQLAVSLAEFARYFHGGGAQIWERQALCKARVVHASGTAEKAVMQEVWRAAYDRPWQVDDASAICDMRRRLAETAPQGNLKRARGGIVDIEFLVQRLQLEHAGRLPELRKPNTLEALAALRSAGLLSSTDFEFLGDSYRFLRKASARMRLLNATARDNLPENPQELEKLARQLGFADHVSLLDECQRVMEETKSHCERLMQ